MILKTSKSKLCVNRDWLQWSGQMKLAKGENVEEPGVCCPAGYTMELLDGTNIYRHRAYLLNRNGVKVLTVLWSPKARWLNRRLIQFEVANHILYSVELFDIIELTYQIHNYTFLCISRVDLCCDFELSRRHRQVVDGLWHKKLYVAAKHDGNDWWHKDLDEPFPHQLSYGSKNSDFKWKLYNKSKELGVGTNNPSKPYIWEEWDAAGFVITNVWRLEVSVTKSSGFKVNERRMELEDVISNAYMCDLYGKLLERRFVIRKRQRHTRKSNDDVVDFLRFPVAGAKVETRQSSGIAKDATITTQVNKLCQILESTEVLNSPLILKSMSTSLLSLVAKYNLSKWFIMAKGMTVRNYVQSLSGLSKVKFINRNNFKSMAEIGDSLNSCWLRKLWLERCAGV